MYRQKLFFRLSTIIFLVIFFTINSCKKSEKANENSSITNPSVKLAKQWFENTFAVNLTAQPKLNAQAVQAVTNTPFNYIQHIKPNWLNASTYNRLGADVIELPLDQSSEKITTSFKNKSGGKTLYNKNFSRSSFLLLRDSTGYSAYVMTIIADSAYLNGDVNKLQSTTYRKREANFTGIVIYTTPHGKFISSYAYKNGKIQPSGDTNNESQNINASPKNIKVNSGVVVAVCTDYFLEIWHGNELVSSNYAYTTCSYSISGGGGTDGGGTGGGTSSGGGSSTVGTSPPQPPICDPSPPPAVESSGKLKVTVVQPPPTPVDPGDGDGGLPSPTPTPIPCNTVTVSTPGTVTKQQDIIDSLQKYPCAQKLVMSIPNLTDAISTVLNATFGNNNGRLNLIFRAPDVFDGSANSDGYLDPKLSTPSVALDASGRAIVSGNLVVNLNGSVLNSATQDYILATLYHEAYHAFLKAMQGSLTATQFQARYPGVTTVTNTDAAGKSTNYQVLPDHSQMATSFIADLTSLLTSFDKSLSTDLATQIAKGGIIDDPSILPANYAERNSTINSKGIKCQ